MSHKMQSVGNLVAVASYKPNFADGTIEGTVSALGRVAVGEIMETMIVRLYEFVEGRIGREIVGIAEAGTWKPWEVSFSSDDLQVRRSTSWDDEHVQQLAVSGSEPATVVWIEFETRTPGQWHFSGKHLEYVTVDGDVIAVGSDGDIGAAVSGSDPTEVRRKLERGQSETANILPDGYWYRGVVAWIRSGPPQGIFALSVGKSQSAASAKLKHIFAEPAVIVQKSRAGWESFFAHDIPACPDASAQSVAIWNDAWFVLRANRMYYARAPLTHPFGSPSKFNYHHQWLWDSGFHSIVWRWANDAHWAEEEVANLFDNQLDQGRICHEIFYSTWRREDAWPNGEGSFAPTSQPPVLAMAVKKVFERTQDRAWLAKIFPKLSPYLYWWMTVRDPDGDDLAGWGNGYESGLDDSPRWDHITRAGNAYFPMPLEATELNALLVNEWRSVAHLAEALRCDSDALTARSNAQRIKAAMRAKLWDERDGFFYCRDHEEKSIRIKTIGGLLGLMALEPGDPEVEPLVAHLRDESEFWTPYPVPSVAINEKTFNRGQMWRGPTWINTNWLLIRALERLGESATAKALSERTLALVIAEGIPKLWEWYDPISGKALGNMEYGWSTLVIDLMMDPIR